MKNKYQEKFSNKKAPIDKSKLWEQISTNKDFPKKEGNNRGSYLLFIPLVLGLLFLGTYISKSYTISPISKTTETENTNQNTSILESNQTKSIEKNNSEIVNSPVHDFTTESKDVNVNSHDVDNTTENDLTKNKMQSVQIGKTKSSSTKEVSFEKTNVIRTPSSKPILQDSYRTTFSSTKYNSDALSNSSNQFAATTNDLNVGNISTKIIDADERALKLNKELQEELSVISYLSMSTQLLKWENRLLNPKEITVIEIKKYSTPSWSIGLMTGIGITNHDLKNLIREKNIIQLRIENTTNLETQIINLSISKLLPYGIKLSIEGELENAYQRFDFLDSSETVMRNIDSSEGFYSRVTTSTDYELYHRYKFVNINLVASKVVSYKKFRFAIVAGMAYNASFSASGQTLDESSGIQLLSNLREYRSQTNISYFGNLETSYSINKNWNLLSHLRFSTNRTLTSENLNFDHNIRSMSLGLGLEYNF